VVAILIKLTRVTITPDSFGEINYRNDGGRISGFWSKKDGIERLFTSCIVKFSPNPRGAIIIA
jgi:hypothetical protein